MENEIIELNIYFRNDEKIYVIYEDEILYFCNKSFDEVLEEIVNDSNKYSVDIVLHFMYLEEKLVKFYFKFINLLNKNKELVNIFLDRKKIGNIKKLLKAKNIKISSINVDLFSLAKFYKDENVEIFQIGEKESIEFKIENGKIKKIEKHDFSIDEYEYSNNFDFGNMEVVSTNEESLKKIFLKEEIDKNSIDIKNIIKINFRKNDIFVMLFLLIIPLLSVYLLDLSRLEKINKNYEKTLKLKENELKEMKILDYSDYVEDMKMIEDIENEMKRGNYYVMILDLIKASFNGVNYTKIKYENNVWEVEGNSENYSNVVNFEKELGKKYKRIKLDYLKDDNNGYVLFAYSILE